MAQINTTTNSTNSRDMDATTVNTDYSSPPLENIEDLKLPNPPAMHEFPSESIRSEIPSTSIQPQIDPLPDQTYVTRKECLELQPAWIDCDFCRRRTKTRVERVEVPNDNEGLLACLFCLVCPCLICLACMGDKEENVYHYCTGDGCGRKVTHKPPKGSVQVLKPQAPSHEVTRYGVAGTANAPEKVVESMKYERQM